MLLSRNIREAASLSSVRKVRTLDDMTGTPPSSRQQNLRWLLRQRSIWIALLFWTLLSLAFIALRHGPRGTVPFRPLGMSNIEHIYFGF
jgi:hypothetical protein